MLKKKFMALSGLGGSATSSATEGAHNPLHIGHRPISEFWKQYRSGPVLGHGGFGSVYSGIRVHDNLPVAIKVVGTSSATAWGCIEGDSVPLEISLLYHCRHVPGVVDLLDWVGTSNYYYIIMECPSPSKDMFDFICDRRALDEDLAKNFFGQITRTAMQCAEAGVVHRDLKDENIVVDLSRMKLKLVDFGSAAILQDRPYRDFQGTYVYMPPEWIIDKEYHGLTAAVWSLGILLYNMVCGNVPFQQDSEIARGQPKFGQGLSNECQDLIRQCLVVDPAHRISMEKILDHPWLVQSALHRVPRSINTTLSDTSGDSPLSQYNQQSHPVAVPSTTVRRIARSAPVSFTSEVRPSSYNLLTSVATIPADSTLVSTDECVSENNSISTPREGESSLASGGVKFSIGPMNEMDAGSTCELTASSPHSACAGSEAKHGLKMQTLLNTLDVAPSKDSNYCSANSTK